MRNLPSFYLAAALGLGGLAAASAVAAPANQIPARTVAAAGVPALAGWNYRFEDDELESAWAWKTRLDASAPFETRVTFHYKNSGEYLMLRVVGDARRASLRFWRVSGGASGVRVQPIGESEAIINAPAGARLRGQLTLQRSSWRVRALWNGRAVATAFSQLQGLRLGTSTRGAAKLGEARLQPLEPVLLQDDFMRAQGPDDPEVPGQWHRVAGVWKTSGMLGPRADASFNPNPFVFRAEAGQDGTATTMIGKWFWTDYTVTASLRPTLKNPQTPLVASIVAYRQADGTAVEGSIDFRSGRASIKAGNRVLAVGAPFEAAPDQWHRVFFDPGPGTLRLMIDGVERVRAAAAGRQDLAQGEAALQSTLGGGNTVDFDDVRIGPNHAINDDFRRAAIGRWENALGQWQTVLAGAAAAGRHVKVSAGAALALTGNPEREEGLVEATFVALGGSVAPAIGIVFAAQDARDYFAARLRAGQLEIVRFSGGTGKILNSDKALSTSALPGLSVGWREGVITARAAGTTVSTVVSSVPEGRVGAWADGPARSVALTSFRALGAPPGWGERALPDKIRLDPLMTNWASKASAWKAAKDGTRWHTGDFWKEAATTLNLPALAPGASLVILSGANPAQPAAGSRLLVERGANSWNFALSENGQLIKSLALPLAQVSEKTPELRFVRQPLDAGRVALRVAVAGRPILSETAASGTGEGTKVGLRLNKANNFDWENATVSTEHVLDYTFTQAPVDWKAGKGRWEVAERWTCQPQWGFFSGTNSVNPTLWSRFALRDDFTIEAYVMTPMDQTRGERGPSDLNVTVGGNGRDLASGYSFLFSTKDGDRVLNRVLRGDSVAVEKPFAALPNAGNVHQNWFYVRLERRRTPQGLRFRYSVNGNDIIDYTDTKPLPGALSGAGRIAFWTFNGGISIARARVWHTDVETGENKSVPGSTSTYVADADAGDIFSSGALKNAVGQWSTRSEGVFTKSAQFRPVNSGARHALQVINPQSGGDWTLFVTREPIDVAQHPTLRFDYRVPQGAFLNLYLKIDGRWREIGFTGDAIVAKGQQASVALRRAPEPGIDAGLRLGEIAGVVADNNWHTATFNIAEALRRVNADKTLNPQVGTRIEAIAFSAPDHGYLRAGIGGNHVGTTYWISDFQMPATRQTVAAAR